MPPKGYKKPKAAPTPLETCTTCGKVLPGPALKTLLPRLTRVRDDLTALAPPTATAAELANWRTEQAAVAAARLEAAMAHEDLVCFGHDKKKPGRKPRAEQPDPSDPRAPEEKTTRKKRGPAALRAVSDGD